MWREGRRGSYVGGVEMQIKNIRKAGGVAVEVNADSERLAVETTTAPRFTLAGLLAASDYLQPISPEEQVWVNGPNVGKEII